MESLTLPDGRTLEYLLDGPPGGMPVVFHHGTPSGAVRCAPLFDAAVRRGLRVLVHSRPGYAGSTSRADRRVADVAGDVAALLDAIGAGEFVTVGWSGGGPHALATAALLPGRCRGVAVIAGVAPYDADGIDWMAGMGEENVMEFGAAAAGPAQLDEFLAEAAGPMATVGESEIIEAFGDLLSDVDRRALAGGLAGYLAQSCRHALSAGTGGWHADDLAFLSDWGFALDAVRGPAVLWQGDQDRMVPFDHGRWLAAHVPGAEVHLLPGEGHISLLNRFDDILARF
jgi:pimeloyl-ACP methyl ester carboxylesterase